MGVFGLLTVSKDTRCHTTTERELVLECDAMEIKTFLLPCVGEYSNR